ncbi:hypothetical protein EY046_21780, partial [Shigella flexneri]|nr:hypothetical protein [Shigella flexneri]EGD9947977.1 hypothetical protein [Shigella flexneri]
KNRSDSFGFELFRVTLGFSAHYWLLLMPFYFRKECPLNSGYLNMVPALRELMQAKHRAQKAVDELVDCVAELETRVGKFEKLVQEVLR